MKDTFDGNRYGVRVYLVLDTGEVELPSHDGALENINLANCKIRVERQQGIA